MSEQRNELHEIVDGLDDEGVRTVLAAAKAQTQKTSTVSTWPPAWFNVGRSGRSDVASRARELLSEGFGRAR